jgi:hypothetical protein
VPVLAFTAANVSVHRINPIPLLCLALVLNAGVGNECAAAVNSADNSPPPGARPYRNSFYGFQFTVPEGWTVTKTNFEVSHYHEVFLTVNSRRPDLAIHELETVAGTIEFGQKTILQQMQPGEVYISFGHFEGPVAPTCCPDTLDENLQSLLSANPVSPSSEAGLAETSLGFLKRGHRWMISVYLREPISAENRQHAMTLLKSFRFLDAPVGNVAWAEDLAWKQLPENIRAFGEWPVAMEAGWPNSFGQHSVLVQTNGPDYLVRLTVLGLGSWEYSVSAGGKVHPKPAVFNAVGVPASQLPSDLPGKSEGKVDAYWVAPYVRAVKAFGKTTVTSFAKDGGIPRQSTVDNNIQTGHANLVGDTWTAQGINEDWRITPHPASSGPRVFNYAASTPDSRVLVDEFSPKPGFIALDIYVHGKRVNTVGPFLPGPLSNEFVLNDDGSVGLLAWKDESKTTARIIALGTNGSVRFQADCGRDVYCPTVAPDGAGALLLPTTGGMNQNTFMWFTEQGKLRSMDISPSPHCVGWVPETRKSLFETSIGYIGRYQLIDWDTGKRLWDVPCPGGGQAVAIGLTPSLIIFSVGDLYPANAGQSANELRLEIGKQWVRTFYAVNVEDGKLFARWPGQFPHVYLGENREHFLRLADKLFYVDSDEFGEIDLDAVRSKTNGWR